MEEWMSQDLSSALKKEGFPVNTPLMFIEFGLVYFTMAPTLNKITVTVQLFVSWIIHRNCVD